MRARAQMPGIAVRDANPRPRLHGHKPDESASTLTLTGAEHGNHWRLFVNDHATTLTGESLRGLMDLVTAHGERAQLSRITIHRLRKAFEPALGREGAVAFIQTCGGDEYRLAIKPKEYKKRVLATRCFFERAKKALDENSLKTVKKLCHVLGKKQAEKLLG